MVYMCVVEGLSHMVIVSWKYLNVYFLAPFLLLFFLEVGQFQGE